MRKATKIIKAEDAPLGVPLWWLGACALAGHLLGGR